MWVDRGQQGGQVDFEKVVGRDLFESTKTVLVTNCQLLTGFCDRRIVDLILKQIEFDPLPPSILTLVVTDRKFDFVRIFGDRLIDREIHVLFEKIGDPGLCLVGFRQKFVKNFFGEVDLAVLDLIVEGGLLLHETIDFGFQKIKLLRIQRLYEVTNPAFGNFVIDLGL